MSVLVKGIEIPESCIYLDEKANTKFCFFCNHDDTPFCAYRGAGLGLEGERPDWCPLIEVPEPHGDLIDRDALEADICPEWNGLYVPDDAYSEKLIRNAPTVIEAEGSENRDRT